MNREGDPYPGEHWNLEAESPTEACAIIAKKLRLPADWLEAKTTCSNVVLTKKIIKNQKRNKLSALRCEKCNSQKNQTIDNRPVFSASKTRRRRECLVCKHRFTTYEFIQSANMTTAEQEKIDQIEAQLKEASYLLDQAIICLRETELEYASILTNEQIKELPQAYRLRQNLNFVLSAWKFQKTIKQNENQTDSTDSISHP